MSVKEYNPKLASEWHPVKNGELNPSDVAAKSRKKVWWLCKNGHEWEAVIKERLRTGGTGCPYCSGKLVLIGENDLQTCNPILAAEWHPTKNEGLTPSDVCKSSRKKVWWLCNKGHEWQATIRGRNQGNIHGCPYCYQEQKSFINRGVIDLQTYNPILAAEWHPTKNGELTPSDVARASHKKVWWLCNKGHEWEAAIKSRNMNGSGCPYCKGMKVLVGENDLQKCNPTLAAEWHPTKNEGLIPSDVTKASGRKVWWLCKNGHEWQATIYNRKRGRNCPYCKSTKK